MTEFDEITFHKDQAKQLMTSGFELGLNAMQSAIMMERASERDEDRCSGEFEGY